MDIVQIQKRIEQIDKLESENDTQKAYLKGELEASETYMAADNKCKEAQKNKKMIKDEILNIDANKEMIAKIKENTEEIVTLKDILSLELMQLYQVSKSDLVQDSTGEPRKFKLSAKLQHKKNANYNNGN